MKDQFNESFSKLIEKYAIVEENTRGSQLPDNREMTGGYRPGDRIKFTDGVLTSEWFKNQNELTQEITKELHEGDLNLFVDKLISNLGEDGRGFEVVVSRELAPGMLDPNTKISIPTELCEYLQTGAERAAAPIPDSWRGPERVTIKPEPVKPIEEDDVVDSPAGQTMHSDDGTGKLVPGDRKLTDKNTPGSKGGNYTINYLPGS